MNTVMNARKFLINRGTANLVRFFADDAPNKFEKTINEVTLLGRVGADPQQRGNEQHPLVTFSLATHVNYKDVHGNFNQKTDWHRVCVFKPNLRDNVFNYLRKGQRVHVRGRLMYGEMKDNSGAVHVTTSVLADEVIFFQATST